MVLCLNPSLAGTTSPIRSVATIQKLKKVLILLLLEPLLRHANSATILNEHCLNPSLAGTTSPTAHTFQRRKNFKWS